jgi:hypothetical protein
MSQVLKVHLVEIIIRTENILNSFHFPAFFPKLVQDKAFQQGPVGKVKPFRQKIEKDTRLQHFSKFVSTNLLIEIVLKDTGCI